jgi:hypothetical protein
MSVKQGVSECAVGKGVKNCLLNGLKFIFRTLNRSSISNKKDSISAVFFNRLDEGYLLIALVV